MLKAKHMIRGPCQIRVKVFLPAIALFAILQCRKAHLYQEKSEEGKKKNHSSLSYSSRCYIYIQDDAKAADIL